MEKTLDLGAKALVILGGLNWGLYGLLNMDAVNLIFGSIPVLAQAVYALIGLAAVYVGYAEFMQK